MGSRVCVDCKHHTSAYMGGHSCLVHREFLRMSHMNMVTGLEHKIFTGEVIDCIDERISIEDGHCGVEGKLWETRHEH